MAGFGNPSLNIGNYSRKDHPSVGFLTTEETAMTITSPISTGTTAGARSYHLTAEEVAHFDEHGYVILRNRISAPLLERLQEASTQWIADGHALEDENAGDGDYNFATRPSGRVLFRIN